MKCVTLSAAFVLLLSSASPAHGQAWLAKGYQMSAMTYDSLGLVVTLDESGARSRREFERLLTDNGSAYVSAAHALACRTLGIRHTRTPLPATNQRQSRALHPHPHQQLGARRDLPLKPRTHQRP